MKTQKFDVNKMRIASPCPTGWENMEGDNRKRFCDLCSLHVYNISEMTTDEVRKLVTNANGRICARIYKRTDGTVLTRDCPVGVRAYRKRVSYLAGAVFSAVMGLCSAVFGQTDAKKDEKATTKDTEILNTATQNKSGGLKGIVTDANGAVVPNAQVNLRTPDNKVNLDTTSSAEGSYNFSGVPVGTYSITIVCPGFMIQIIQNVKIEENKIAELSTPLNMATEGEVVVGILTAPWDGEVDVYKTNTTTTITRKVLDKLPIN